MEAQSLIIAGLTISVVILLVWIWVITVRNKKLTLEIKRIADERNELEKKSSQLQELAMEKHQVMSMVSHDLKGPFNRIFALVQLMLISPENLTEDQKEYLGKIHQIIADGLAMIRNVLDNRRIEDRGIELSPEELNISLMTAMLLRNYKSLAEKKKIKIAFSAPEQLMLYTDKMSITRVIENLMSNALKFSPSNSSVSVKLEDHSNAISLEIADTGPGISKEDQKKLYQKFQPLSAKPTGGESSTGLGLSIAKILTEKLGGTIHCESEEGTGTKFIVRILKDQLKR